MKSIAYFSLLMTIKVDLAIGVNDSHNNKNNFLSYYTMDTIVPCGDGSPAGFYSDAYTSNTVENKHHIINFMGGGGCANKLSCEAIWEQQPYMLSSSFEAEKIEGHTILSSDPIENPSMAAFAKWNVPYCSQDLWLGDAKLSGEFIRSGSVHVKAFLDHWLAEVLKADASIDTLVVAGVSAGTMAILNHFEAIQSVAEVAGVKSLRLVMDSSLYADRLDTDFSSLFDDILDPDQHPLCFKNSTESIQHKSLSKLPCCLSTHCMLRHSNVLARWARGSGNKKERVVRDERLLLIDAAYDSLQTFLDLSSDSSLANALPSSGLMSLSGLSSSIFNVGEFVGSRKERVEETLFGGERQIGSNVLWVMSSAASHNVLIPSVEMTSRLCQSGKQAAPASCNGAQDCVFSNYPGGVYQVCNSTGSGLKVPISDGLHMTLWTTTESWKRVTVGGRSIQNIISQFIAPATGGVGIFSEENRLLIDSCPGPNCVPIDSDGGNAAQSLIEIDDTFMTIPLWLRVLVSIFALSIPLVYVLAIVCHRKTIEAKDTFETKQGSGKAKGCAIHLTSLYVQSKSGDKILDDISIHLKSSTLNCLLGKSGSGKSTLLGVLR